jgi:hypothetical protein
VWRRAVDPAASGRVAAGSPAAPGRGLAKSARRWPARRGPAQHPDWAQALWVRRFQAAPRSAPARPTQTVVRQSPSAPMPGASRKSNRQAAPRPPAPAPAPARASCGPRSGPRQPTAPCSARLSGKTVAVACTCLPGHQRAPDAPPLDPAPLDARQLPPHHRTARPRQRVSLRRPAARHQERTTRQHRRADARNGRLPPAAVARMNVVCRGGKFYARAGDGAVNEKAHVLPLRNSL